MTQREGDRGPGAVRGVSRQSRRPGGGWRAQFADFAGAGCASAWGRTPWRSRSTTSGGRMDPSRSGTGARSTRRWPAPTAGCCISFIGWRTSPTSCGGKSRPAPARADLQTRLQKWRRRFSRARKRCRPSTSSWRWPTRSSRPFPTRCRTICAPRSGTSRATSRCWRARGEGRAVGKGAPLPAHHRRGRPRDGRG